jgi:hypothetical protein
MTSKKTSTNVLQFSFVNLLLFSTASSPFPANARKTAATAKANLCPMNFIAGYYNILSPAVVTGLLREPKLRILCGTFLFGVWVFECLGV